MLSKYLFPEKEEKEWIECWVRLYGENVRGMAGDILVLLSQTKEALYEGLDMILNTVIRSCILVLHNRIFQTPLSCFEPREATMTIHTPRWSIEGGYPAEP